MKSRLVLVSASWLVVACAEPTRAWIGDAAVADVHTEVMPSDATRVDAVLPDAAALDAARDAAVDAVADVAADAVISPSSGSIAAPVMSDDFGSALAMSEDGNTLVVGDWTGGPGGVGAAFVYSRSGGSWNSGTPLPRPATAAAFGNSIAISDDGSVVVVGDWSGGENAVGRAYVYLRSSNYSVATVLVPPASARDFGWSIAISGDGTTIAVGDYNANQRGEVSVYTRNNDNWSAAFVVGPFAGAGGFGDDVALSRNGGILVVGDTNGGGDGDGAATVYQRSNGNWDQGTSLTRPTGTQSFGFGVAINRDGNAIAVGDPSGGGDTLGHVSLYRLTNGAWTGTAIARPARASAFGAAVRLNTSGGSLLVGDFEGDSTGAAHVFSGSDAASLSVRTLARPNNARGFGRAVAMAGDGQFAAVSDEDGGASQLGLVSLFAL